ncbi:PaaI family thioesterase [Ktedonosporobacter rubrisoli]|uniref:Acyl-coenzyme A thioesterase THEM4 n=1 Tax=Ktedonosporobacter rubrisoli TaxID=2509675 RepID=A0A4P6JND1_KTERU|nr:PaaI family thioesterase [Ktedonosporobacter rubrisoli]QBD76572.1 PaaI family thioesterase [Ktedonosporobacter rubrisoli]
MEQLAFQDVFSGDLSQCWGCGCHNPHGLQIKSYWAEEGQETICTWQPQDQHTAAWLNVLSGGIIASLIDCHSVSTAMMVALHDAGYAWTSEPPVIYITASLQVTYLKPTPMTSPVTIRARVTEKGKKKMLVQSSLFAQDELCARGEVVAVRYTPATQ